MQSQPESNSERQSLLFAVGLFCLPLGMGLLIFVLSQLMPALFVSEAVPTVQFPLNPSATPYPDVEFQLVMNTIPHAVSAQGESIFYSSGCSACHSLDSTRLVGPPLNSVSERTQDEYDSPEQYLLVSIVMPGEYIVGGYSNVMPPFYAEQLTTQDLADLIAFLMEQ
jgi:cytochrome c551/c552